MSAALAIITMRDADLEDCERVFAWNCAPEVRALSGDPRIIELAEHQRWYRRRVVGGWMWIVEDENAPVGVVRLDPYGGVMRISIALSTKARGRGIGQRAIRAACEAYGLPIEALIRAGNTRSTACFHACGFTLAEVTEEFVTYRWSP